MKALSLKVKKEAGPLLSLIHYKSSIFMFVLIIITSLLFLAVAYGLVHYYRERKYQKEMRAISLKHNFKELQDKSIIVLFFNSLLSIYGSQASGSQIPA